MAKRKKQARRPRQLLIGMYDVFDPGSATEKVGMVAVYAQAGGGQFDTIEHWAFLRRYGGIGRDETLRVVRKTTVTPTDDQWRDFLRFLNADPANIYIRAECTQRAHPVS